VTRDVEKVEGSWENGRITCQALPRVFERGVKGLS